jgi:hypothetical protein
MKRFFLSLTLALGMLVSIVHPANAVFGLSKCEKVKKEISHEESIGLLYFKDYAKQRKTLQQMLNPKRSNVADVLSWIGSVFDSDLKVYEIVEKNTKCFSAAQVIDARNRAFGTQRLASEAAGKRVMYAYKISDPASKDDLSYVNKLYPTFYSFFNAKKKLA